MQLGHFAVQPSLLFSQKGYCTPGFTQSLEMFVATGQDYRLSYLTLPVNLAYALGRDG